MGAPTQISTTKKPPNLAMRGLLFWLNFIQLFFRLLALEPQLVVLQFALGLVL